MTPILSAYIFTALTGIVMVFQACLAAGLPWGAASVWGTYPGTYPPKMRWIAVVNVVILLFLAIVVLSRAGLFLPEIMPFSQVAIWLVVVFSLFGTVMNTISPSKIERIWAPVTLLQLVTSVIVALG